ncbi:hypothetical protein BU23DRAFT_598702 [Bimuria novae-zelandiae CBS 107.79]|uniref:Uncharacterized protein n=1 Tax=Bimuria novae-zelandiae CBS 107.79 TaxID=1447943 RepID=A0A6A5VAX2_9PLEO|nr:hypothetical protein BU23DRAFT_598702 [Bimuria novae-zelandiae CBS 107.79]
MDPNVDRQVILLNARSEPDIDPTYSADTFSELLGHLECDDFRHHTKLANHITSAAAYIARMRQACIVDSSIESTDLARFFATIERLIARGWYQAIEKQGHKDSISRQYRSILKEITETQIKLRESEPIPGECKSLKFHSEALWNTMEDNSEKLMKLRKSNEALKEQVEKLTQEKSDFVQRIESNLQRPAQIPYQTGDAEAVEQLIPAVDNLRPVVEALERLTVSCEPVPDVPPPNRLGTLSDINEDNDEVRLFGSGWGDKDLLLTQESVRIDEDRWANSSVVTQAGDTENSSTSYPPPLAPATEEASKADERKTDMLSEVEHTLWIQESKDREYLARKSRSRSTASYSPSSSLLGDSDPFYIYIPLPRNFTIPQSNRRLPSVTFPSPPSVFYFPGCATRDQLLATLRKRYHSSDLEPIDDINIIRVRTHELEWELKNAIGRITTQQMWDQIVGDNWSTEGRGDTYVVSKRDVRFHGMSNDKNTMAQSNSSSAASEKSEVASNEVAFSDQSWPEDYYKEDHHSDDGVSEDVPHLRGGALTASTSSSTSGYSEYDQGLLTLEDHCEFSTFASVHEDDPHTQLQAWIEHARILQLQNVSHSRMVEHLQEILKDTEDTVLWQDEELARAHRHIADLKRKVSERREEALAAGRKAELARAETELLQEQLKQIHDQVVQFGAELDDKELNMLQQYSGISAAESPSTVELRGGGDSLSETGSSTSAGYSIVGATPGAEESTPGAEAHSFYFFPTVSMVVVLSNPLHHFQFTKNTSLAQVRQILYKLHLVGREKDPHLRQVRGILQARDEAGIELPDTSNGRQVLISAPDDDTASVASGKPGYKGQWKKSFGPSDYQFSSSQRSLVEDAGVGKFGTLQPALHHNHGTDAQNENLLTTQPRNRFRIFCPSEYNYEHMLKVSIESLRTPATEHRALLSPTASVYGEKLHNSGILMDTVAPPDSPGEDEFYNVADLIDEIEHKAEISRERSGYNMPYICKEIPQEPHEETHRTRSRADNLGEKRGYTMSLPLPPTTVGAMFPTDWGSSVPLKSPCLHRQVTPGIYVPETVGATHPARLRGYKASKLLAHVPLEVNHPHLDELDRSANFGFEQDLSEKFGSKRHLFPSGPSEERMKVKAKESAVSDGEKEADDDWGMCRHRKGEGCEAWMTPSGLDPDRDHCAFCGLPFVQASWKKWEFEDRGAPTGCAQGDARVGDTGDSSPEDEGSYFEDRWDPKEGPSNPYLRGGAEELEGALLQNANYDSVSLSWTADEGPERPKSPRKRVFRYEGEDQFDYPMYDRREPACERHILHKRVRFVPGKS